MTLDLFASMKRDLRQHYGLSAEEPTQEQFDAIISDLRQFSGSKQYPTEEELGEIVKKHCKTFQTVKYAKREH
ncbi:hypothetical protein [Myxococcus qinghaiensis]|uniref:hypothetical protein n=1 Tax=Myxococcus qinghaiensis TaxID=2906758 RepID=UPI0020A7D7A7|nr:hypothetical protein [Myxococcus qinghaiensis]MCP3162830.1 hypothetical protein [Myxococcus qinghaiensis]